MLALAYSFTRHSHADHSTHFLLGEKTCLMAPLTGFQWLKGNETLQLCERHFFSLSTDRKLTNTWINKVAFDHLPDCNMDFLTLKGGQKKNLLVKTQGNKKTIQSTPLIGLALVFSYPASEWVAHTLTRTHTLYLSARCTTDLHVSEASVLLKIFLLLSDKPLITSGDVRAQIVACGSCSSFTK